MNSYNPSPNNYNNYREQMSVEIYNYEDDNANDHLPEGSILIQFLNGAEADPSRSLPI